ncbi:MAG: PAS domain S-box protein [Bacteroidetes bacterium]|nr:PAS domain S-box protein [Bacteroidota bacterium]
MKKNIKKSDKTSRKADLLLSESTIELFFKMSSDLFCVVKNDGYFLELNPEWENLLGYTTEELMSKPFTAFLHPDDVERTIKEYQEELKGKDVFNFVNRYVCKDKSIKWFEWRGKASPDRKSAFAVAREITKRINAEHLARETESRFRSSFNLPQIGATITSLDKGWIEVNDGLVNMLGYTKEELKNKTWADLTHKDDLEKDFVLFNRVLSGEIDHYSLEKRFIHKNGKVVWTIMSAACVRKVDGKVDYFVALLQDITKQKTTEHKLKESEQLFHNIFRSHGAVKLLIDPVDGTIFDANEAAAEYYGFPLDKLKAMKMTEINTLDTEQVKSLMNESVRNSKNQFCFKHRLASGEIREVEVITSPVEIGNKKLLFSIVYDITEKNVALRSLEESEKKLKEVVAQKDKFFSIIAHDLKNPFNAIIGFSSILSEEIKKRNLDEIENFASLINQASERVLNLLLNLLKWSQSQTGRLEFIPEYLDMVHLLKEAVGLFEDSASHKSISLKTHLPAIAPLYADKEMIGTVIRNLISNAIKYTDPGGEIKITMEQEPHKLLISITDNGIGMDNETVEGLLRIDKSYSKPGTLNEQGTGLGLILCKEFIDKHRGKFIIESEKGKGSKFTIELPSV